MDKVIDRYTVKEPGGKIIQRFRTVGEYIDYVNVPLGDPGHSRWGGSEWSSHTVDRYSWYGEGGGTWEETMAMAEYGWPKGVETINKFVSKLNTVLSGWIKQPEVVYGYRGLSVDRGKYQAGNPKFMMKVQDSAVRLNAQPPRIVRVVFNICSSASQDEKVFLWRGAAIGALVTMLERHGTRVQVDLNASNRAGRGLETWVTIKEPEFPLNMPHLAFQLAHAASFRRLVFSAWEHLPREERQPFGIPNGGYGYVGESTDRGDIYLSGAESERGWSEDFTLSWIKSQLEKLGIEVDVK